MRVLPDLPDLRVLPTASLHPHEHHDERRAAPLAADLRRDGVLRNPPIVLPLAAEAETYLVLDGANRTAAFRQMGLEYVLAQIVHPEDDKVTVDTWNHVVLDREEETLLSVLRQAHGVDLTPTDAGQAASDLAEGRSLAYVSLRGGRVVSLSAPVPDLRSRVEGLNRIVGAYQTTAMVERTNASSLDEVLTAFPAAAGLMVFLGFDVAEVVRAASQGLLLPAGLTRFVVSPRALRVNYPLDRLAASAGREALSEALRHWLQEKVAGREVRFYAEATYLFDE